jgi:hypothetical protein
MLNHYLFTPGFTGSQKTNAIAGARQLGYELYITNVAIVDARVGGSLAVNISLRNLGVAPFYYDWPVQLRVLNTSNQTVQTWNSGWQLTPVLPAPTNTTWSLSTNQPLVAGQYKLLLRVQNPLTNGVTFRFANQAQDADQAGWLTLGQFSVLPALTPPKLSGSLSNSAILLNIKDPAAGTWAVETASNLNNTWQPLFVTNTGASNWDFVGPFLSESQSIFFRVKSLP